MLFQRSLVALLGHPVSVVCKGALEQCSCQQRLHVLKIALLDRISARPSVELMTDCTKQQSQSCCIEREIDRALGPVHHSPIRRCTFVILHPLHRSRKEISDTFPPVGQDFPLTQPAGQLLNMSIGCGQSRIFRAANCYWKEVNYALFYEFSFESKLD